MIVREIKRARAELHDIAQDNHRPFESSDDVFAMMDIVSARTEFTKILVANEKLYAMRAIARHLEIDKYLDWKLAHL